MPRRRNLLAIAAALAALAVAIGLVAQYNKESRVAVQKEPASVPVTVAPVVAKTVPVRLIAIGNVEPFTTVAVKARVDGQIVSVHFKEGDEVTKGALLFEIDPRPLAATLKQAQASLLKDKALLDRRSSRRSATRICCRRISSRPMPTTRSRRTWTAQRPRCAATRRR
jgi:multidrug efflux system membrane fusion protein